MRLLVILRLLVISIVLLSTGIVTGWWLHHRWSPPTIIITSESSSNTQPFFDTQPSFPSSLPLPTSPDVSEFILALEELRYDDALIIYQRNESNNSDLADQLRTRLLNHIEQLSARREFDVIANTLERFTHYYYQDFNLLKQLAAAYESKEEQEKALNVYINARAFLDQKKDQNSDQKDRLDFLNDRIHRLAKERFVRHKKSQTLEDLLPQFQKMALLEPEYGFYRFALAESYLSMGDIESAIRELEILQIDPEFGNRAASLLAKLLPPPPVEEIDMPVNTIPLTGSGNRFIVNVVAGEQLGAELLIDTGATLTTLPKKMLSELKKQKKAKASGQTELSTANGIRFARLYKVRQFQIGNYTLHNLEVAELELNDRRSDGLLGMNVLDQFHFFIDQNQRSLTLTPR